MDGLATYITGAEYSHTPKFYWNVVNADTSGQGVCGVDTSRQGVFGADTSGPYTWLFPETISFSILSHSLSSKSSKITMGFFLLNVSG
jgi:hypothetical protein